MASDNKKLKVLSASRIKTLETCSWVYWNNYHTKVPQTNNDGALRGTVCHTIFELLLNPKHKSHFNKIIKNNSVDGSKAVSKLIKKSMKKSGLDESNYEILNDMIMVGLKHDFFGENDGKIVSPEYAFEIQSDSPKYHIKGFIDKPIKSKNKMVIVDYKSSKAKFRGDDLEANIQAMMYSLASKKLWPKLSPIVRFLFLRFPKQPIQELVFDDDQIKGFEHYLEYVNKYINDFNENSAESNFAVDNPKNKWMCSVGNWKCPYKDSFDYYVKLNDKNEIVESNFTGEFKDIKGFTVEKRKYAGCPRHNNASINQQPKDAFDDLT
jgi:hypothetical protein